MCSLAWMLGDECTVADALSRQPYFWGSLRIGVPGLLSRLSGALALPRVGARSPVNSGWYSCSPVQQVSFLPASLGQSGSPSSFLPQRSGGHNQASSLAPLGGQSQESWPRAGCLSGSSTSRKPSPSSSAVLRLQQGRIRTVCHCAFPVPCLRSHSPSIYSHYRLVNSRCIPCS